MTLGVKITELPAAGAIVGTEQFEVVQSGQSKQVTANGLMGPHTSATGTAVHGLGTMSTQSANSVAITGGAITGITNLAANSVAITGGTITGITNLAVTGGTITGITNLSATGGTITGITDLAIADGGTGASTAAGARTALGSTATGDALFTAASTAAARGTLGSTTIGDAVFTAASTAAAQTALSLVPGTDVQAYDATLTSIASKGTAADKMLYTTGVDTWAEAAITSAGRSLVAGANAAAQLATLGTESFNTFVSADQTITTGGALTLAHGLGVAPRFPQVMLVCQTAEAGYSAGDVVTPVTRPPAIRPDATNLNIRYSDAPIVVNHSSTGSQTAITAANWKARFYAIK